MRFVLTGGGTAGHINPALGVAQKLKSLLPDAEFLFVGAEGMMETELVPREGYPLRTIAISGLSRSLSLAGLKHNAVTLRQLIRGEKHPGGVSPRRGDRHRRLRLLSGAPRRSCHGHPYAGTRGQRRARPYHQAGQPLCGLRDGGL